MDRRGRYDRSLSLAERAARQRLRILGAALEVLDELGAAAVTVAPVIGRAQVGRNTFYAHFDDVADLLGGVREWATDELLDDVRARERACFTPLERLRALAEAWVEAIVADPKRARTALSHVVGADPRHLGSRAADRIAAELHTLSAQAVRDGLVAAPPAAAMLLALGGAFVSVGLSLVDRRSAPPGDAADALATLSARALR